MAKIERNNDEINYYNLLVKLREHEYKLSMVNENGILSNDLDILLLQVKAFIFEHDILKKEFLLRQKAFYQTTKTSDYKKRYSDVYQQIQQIAANRAQKVKRILKYVQPCTEDSLCGPFNAIVEDNDDSRVFMDVPEHYYFPSLLSDTAELTGIFPSKEDASNFKILPSLQCFYRNISVETAAIRVWRDEEQKPYTKAEHLNEAEKITESLFFIPKDLEFYIASADIKIDILCESFSVFFYATSICYVLNELQKFIQKELSNRYYSKQEQPLNNQNKPTLHKRNNEYHINCKKLNLGPAEIDLIDNILNLCKVTGEFKQRVYGINQKSRQLCGMELIEFNQKTKVYNISKKIRMLGV